MRNNLTFRGGEPFWANACVGNNGMPGYYDYAKGFSAAANLLIKAALSNNGCSYPVDIFVYPICFNMRHSVELRLKGAVDSLTKMAKQRAPAGQFDLDGSHDIGKIWGYFKTEANRFDDRINFYVDLLDEYIEDIAEVDSTGQTFRYPYSNLQQKHLVSVENINVAFLYFRFQALEFLLDSLEVFIGELEKEYRWGTYTKNLTRPQILSIAKKLPSKDQWGSTEFISLRERVKFENAIGSKEFSEVVTKIKSLYRTTDSCFAVPELKFLNMSDIRVLVKHWISLHPIESTIKSPMIDSLDLDDIESIADAMTAGIKKSKKVDAVASELLKQLSRDKVSDINALYEASVDRYPESYPFHVEYYQADSETGQESDRRFLVQRLLKKPDFLERILKSLYLIGHYAKAEMIISEFNLIGSFAWISLAKENKMFIDPCTQIINSCRQEYEKSFVKKRSELMRQL